MNVFVYSLNYAPELTGIGKYNYEMVRRLSELGVSIRVITAPPYYPEWRHNEGYSYFWYTNEVAEDILLNRCPLYVPKKVTTIKRLLHLMSFAFSSGLRLLSLIFKKPDIVFLVQPTFFCAPITLLYCKITGAKSVMHIQDYELDAMLGLGMGSPGKVTKVLKSVESWFLTRFDAVSTISYSMLDKAKEKGVKESKLFFFPNWADTEFVTPQTCGLSFKKKLGYNSDDKIVLYAGNIGKKQGLEIVLQAAAHFKSSPNVKFLMVGAGAHVDELKNLAETRNLNNLRFLPLQEWEDVPAMLAMTDLHLVVQKKGAADAVLPSKLTNILAAGGNAIVTAEESTELGQIAKNYPGIYRLIEPEDVKLLVDAIEDMLSKKSDEDFNKVARKYAEDNLNKHVIIKRLLEELNSRLLNCRTA